MSTTDPPYAEGSEWLHVWTAENRAGLDLWVGFQYEAVRVRITAAPALPMSPRAARRLIALLQTLPGAIKSRAGVSVPIPETE